MIVTKLLHSLSFFQKKTRELFTRGSGIEKFFFFSYLISSLFLLLYSYTQIDLGLVITRVPLLYGVEKQFQYIGYFNRPLSTVFFIVLIIIFLLLYISFLLLTRKRKIKSYTIWSIIGVVTIILAFSYNAFSYDLFNYMFDAKILTHYHQNPYIQKALDYPQDPMLGFMHWTHRSFPYGPIWLVLTVALSFSGSQIFLLTFYLFKLFAAACFLGTAYFISRIFQKTNPQWEPFGLVFFGLNPLILLECLVSAHIDIAMTFFMLLSLYLLIEKKFTFSYLSLFVSIGIKFLTVVLLPVYIIFHFLKTKKTSGDLFISLCLSFLILGVIIETHQSGNFQPWYLVVPLSVAVFLSQRYFIFIPSLIISVASLFLYVPYLYLGNWNPPVPQTLSLIEFSSLIASLIGVTGYFFYKKLRKM